ncbi:MAG: hypothetical protein F4X00_16675 [Gemmatimonadetes bacterium]|nr:hypothetical protein [Gemmatimonadota bacterium]
MGDRSNMSSHNEWIRAIAQLQKMVAESEFARHLAAAQRALDELAKSEFARKLVAAQRAAEKALGESEVARILADVQRYLTGPDGAKLAEAIKRAQANLALFDQLSPEADEDEPEAAEDEDENE